MKTPRDVLPIQKRIRPATPSSRFARRYSWRLAVIFGLLTYARAAWATTVIHDPSGDAAEGAVEAPPAVDIVRLSGGYTDTNVVFTVTFRQDSLAEGGLILKLYLDTNGTNEDRGTWPAGTDYYATWDSGTGGAMSVREYGTFQEVGTVPLTFLPPNSYRMEIPLSLLGNDDGPMNFGLEAGEKAAGSAGFFMSDGAPDAVSPHTSGLGGGKRGPLTRETTVVSLEPVWNLDETSVFALLESAWLSNGVTGLTFPFSVSRDYERTEDAQIVQSGHARATINPFGGGGSVGARVYAEGTNSMRAVAQFVSRLTPVGSGAVIDLDLNWQLHGTLSFRQDSDTYRIDVANATIMAFALNESGDSVELINAFMDLGGNGPLGYHATVRNEGGAMLDVESAELAFAFTRTYHSNGVDLNVALPLVLEDVFFLEAGEQVVLTYIFVVSVNAHGDGWASVDFGDTWETQPESDTPGVTFKVVPPRPILSINREGDEAIVTWSGDAILQTATDLTGVWSDVPAAQSPYRTPLGNGPVFFRARIE